MRLQRTHSPHIDVAHVALAKVNVNYIAVNSSCILPRQGTCLALRFQTGSWMLCIDSQKFKQNGRLLYCSYQLDLNFQLLIFS